MSIGGTPSAQIEFLAPTRDDQGRTIHHPGERITGQLLAQHYDFLLVQSTAGTLHYVDTTRTDLYRMELNNPS